MVSTRCSLTFLKNPLTKESGTKLTLKAAKPVAAKGAYFITSTGAVAAPLQGSGEDYTVTVPAGAQAGQEYLVLTKDMNAPTDENIVAGPAVVQVADNDYGMTQGKSGWQHSWGSWGYGKGKWGSSGKWNKE